MNDMMMSKNAWSPGRMMRSVKLCGCGLHRPAHARHAGERLALGDLRGVETMVPRGRAEVPYPRLAGAAQQAPARELVARPLADDGPGQITDVVLVEHEHGAEPGFRERLTRAAEALGVQALEVHALLEVHLRVAGRLQRTIPARSRIDVIGADGSGDGGRRLAGHGI